MTEAGGAVEKAVMPRADPTPPAGRKYAYAAFISYSHHDEAELRIARAIEHGLEQLGKRWGRWRALDVFLDQHDLGANPGLETKLRDAIGGSEFFIFLASPASASADSWCSKELLHWFEARGSEAAGHLLIVVTDGQLVFNDSADDVIDWDHSTAAPAVLRARLGVEPFYVDVSADRDRADRLDVRRDPSFRESVTKLAAPLHHCSPQELDSEDLRQYRRGRRLRRLAVGALAALAVAAAIAALLAVANTIEADRQSRRSESRALANVALTNATAERDLALLQALESIRVADTTDAWGSLLGVLGEPSRFQQRSTGAHDAVVTSVAWSDDGHLAATGDDAGAVVVWDVVADSLVHPSTARAYSPLQGSTAAIQHVDFFERDGATVVEGLSVDGSYVVWDVATGEAITVGDAPAVALTAAARADDGGAVACAVDTDGDGGADVVRTYDDGHVVAEAEVAGETVDHLHFQPSGRALAWSEGQAVRVWDLAGQPALAIEVETPVSSVGFSADGALLAVGEFEGAIWLVDLADADRPSWEVEPRPTSPPIAVAFAPGGSMAEGYMLASAHLNGQVRVSGTLDRVAWAEDTLLGHKEVATALAFDAAGQIVSASYDGEVLWWSAAPFVGIGEAVPGGGDRHASDVTSVAFLDEETVVSLDAAGAVILTDLTASPSAGESVAGTDGGAISVLDAAADMLVLGGSDGSIEVIAEPSTAEPDSSTVAGGHASAVYALDLSDDGTSLVSVDDDDSVVVWDLTDGTAHPRPDLPPDLVVYSVLHGGNGRVWVGGSRDGSAQAVVFEIDAVSGALVGEPIVAGKDWTSALALSPDGRTLATGAADRTIRLWDTGTHEALGVNVLAGHRDEVSGLAFTPDGRNLVSIDRDLVVNFWDVGERRLVATLHGPYDGINDLALSVDGSSLIVASEDDTVYLWPLDRRQWITAACALAGRNLTPDEWQLYGSGAPRRLCEQYDGDGPPVDWSERLDG